jgi:hypothetical protein
MISRNLTNLPPNVPDYPKNVNNSEPKLIVTTPDYTAVDPTLYTVPTAFFSYSDSA